MHDDDFDGAIDVQSIVSKYTADGGEQSVSEGTREIGEQDRAQIGPLQPSMVEKLRIAKQRRIEKASALDRCDPTQAGDLGKVRRPAEESWNSLCENEIDAQQDFDRRKRQL